METEDEAMGWTKENLQKLLASMKQSIPEHDRMAIFTNGMKKLNWNNVAFSHFSPEECLEKWKEMLEKMRTLRTLTELIDEAEDELSSGNKTKRTSHMGLPLLPRRPAPPNSIFYRENVGRFRKQHPDLTHSQVFKLVYQKYMKLPDKEKAKYLEKFEKEKAEYYKEMAKFRLKERKSALTGNEIEGESIDSALPPKPPGNGYLLFCKEQRFGKAVPRPGQSKSLYTKRWHEMSKQQRGEYAARCKELKRRYTEALNNHQSTLEGNVRVEAVKRPQTTYVNTAAKSNLPDEPKMPPLSGSSIFIQKQMKQLKRKLPDFRQRFLKVNRLWKNMSKRQRQRYRSEAKKGVNEYSSKLQEWFKTLTPTEQEDYWAYKPSKHKYLGGRLLKYYEEDQHLQRPSDSEDEEMEDSSDSSFDEEGAEDDEEEETDDVTFDMY